MELQNTQKTNLHQQLTKSSPSLDVAVESIAKIQNAGKLTISKAIQGRQLSHYKREDGEAKVGAVLTGLVLSIADSYNIGKSITELQAAEIAKAILKDFWYLKLAELYLFAEKAKNGEFGKVYDRLDRAVIFEWLRAYDVMREDQLFSDMQGSNETDDTPEVDEETKKSNQEKADKALEELAKKMRLDHPGGNLRDKLTDPRFRAMAYNYEVESEEQKAIREHNQKIDNC